jgi:hypothetical protein
VCLFFDALEANKKLSEETVKAIIRKNYVTLRYPSKEFASDIPQDHRYLTPTSPLQLYVMREFKDLVLEPVKSRKWWWFPFAKMF